MQFGISGSVLFLPASGTLPKVRGGFGFGMGTRGAWSGSTDPTFLKINNVTDLRNAINAVFPRVLIFETCGDYDLAFNDLNLTNPYIDIWGSTAPGQGVRIKNGGLSVLTHDVYIEGIAIRPGDGGPILPPTADHDGSIIYGGPTGINVYNVVLDHNSISWAGDKLTLAGSLPINANVTYWRNIFSESLYRAINIEAPPGGWAASGGPSSLGMLLKQSYVGWNANISVIQNLFAHNSDRNPEIQGPISVHIINNIMYNWGKDSNPYPWATFLYSDSSIAGGDLPSQVDVIGNVYIAGPTPSPFTPLYAIGSYSVPTGTKLYIFDNIIDSTKQAVILFSLTGFDPRVGIAPVSLTGISVLSGASTKASVLTNAGMRPLARNTTDARIITEVTNYNGSMISSQNTVGGYPSIPVINRPLTLPSNPNAVGSTGYRIAEEWFYNNYYVPMNGS